MNYEKIYLFTLASSAIWAQETYPDVYYYYVEEKIQGELLPSNKQRDSITARLDLSFTNSQLDDYFSEKEIYALQSLRPNPAKNQVQEAYQTQGAT